MSIKTRLERLEKRAGPGEDVRTLLYVAQVAPGEDRYTVAGREGELSEADLAELAKEHQVIIENRPKTKDPL